MANPITFIQTLPLQVIGWVVGILLILGTPFAIGYSMGNHRADVRIAAYEKTIHDTAVKVEVAQGKTNQVIVDRWHTKIQKVYVERYTNKALAATSVKETGNLPAGWVYVHNLSINGNNGDPKLAGDNTDSKVSSTAALGVIVDNNATCKAEIAKLEAFQQYYLDSQKNIAAANAKPKKFGWFSK